MKKAGLCVRYDCNNFGSMLQIFATQKTIRRMGWEYEIIRYNKKTTMFYIKNVTRVFNPFFMKGKIQSLKKNLKLKNYPLIQKGNKRRNQCIAEFRKEYIGPYSKEFKGFRNLKKGVSNYDAMIVGSDQLWTPAGIKSKFYNLLFVPDKVKKISFATSFGVGEIPKYQKRMTSEYLERIDYISVREIRGSEIVKELTGRDSTIALDPTLLYTKDEWDSFFPEKRIIDDSYILAYFLGGNEKHRDAVELLKKETGLKIVTIPFMDVFFERDLSFGDLKLFEISPIDFLNLVRGADYVCTDSFHGTVFSILNHKRFVTFNRTNNNDKQTRNSRIDSLFELLGLEKQRYTENAKLIDILSQNINYAEVDQRLVDLRKETLSFLNNSLNS